MIINVCDVVNSTWVILANQSNIYTSCVINWLQNSVYCSNNKNENGVIIQWVIDKYKDYKSIN